MVIWAPLQLVDGLDLVLNLKVFWSMAKGGSQPGGTIFTIRRLYPEVFSARIYRRGSSNSSFVGRSVGAMGISSRGPGPPDPFALCSLRPISAVSSAPALPRLRPVPSLPRDVSSPRGAPAIESERNKRNDVRFSRETGRAVVVHRDRQEKQTWSLVRGVRCEGLWTTQPVGRLRVISPVLLRWAPPATAGRRALSPRSPWPSAGTSL